MNTAISKNKIRKKNGFFAGFFWKLTFKMSLALLLLMCLLWGLHQLKNPHNFPIRVVNVVGANQYVNHQEVQKLLTPLVTTGFFTLNIEVIKDKLLKMPWLSDVIVQRIWPNQVTITLVERKPIARWNYKTLLSVNGELFSPAPESFPQGLPEFFGPEGQQIEILKRYREINLLLIPLHNKVVRLHLSPDQAWDATLDSGINLALGQDNVLTRVAHFVKVYDRFFATRATQIDNIDLRYTNGLAVRWRPTTS